MLQFQTGWKKLPLPTGQTVPQWQIWAEVRLPQQATGVRLEMKLDTGADYTVLPASIAPILGIHPNALKQSSQHVAISSASNHKIHGHLWTVEFHVEDDYFGFAEWTGQVVFCDPDPRKPCAGKVGFLQYLRFRDDGPKFYLDPIQGFPGKSQCAKPR